MIAENKNKPIKFVNGRLFKTEGSVHAKKTIMEFETEIEALEYLKDTEFENMLEDKNEENK